MPLRHNIRPSRSRKRCETEHKPLDLYHNRDTPCCRLLNDVAVEIRDNRSTLATVLWFLLRRQRDNEVVSAGSLETDDKAGKLPLKKKTRKKKKKAMQDLKKPADDERKSMSTDVESGDGDVDVSRIVNFDQDASAQKLLVPQRTRHDHFEMFIDCLLANFREQVSRFSVEHLPSLRQQLRTIRISHDKLLHALNDIACQSCRRSLEYFVANHDQVRLAPREEATFDYVAMEEGTLPGACSNEAVFRLVKQTSGGALWELHCADNNADHTDLPHILDLTYDFILVRGFSQDDRMHLMGYKVIELQTSVINSIRMSSTSKCREIEAFIKEIKTEVNEKKIECHRTDVESSANLDYNFDAFPRLNAIDTKLDTILQNLHREVVQPMTRSYFSSAENLHMEDDTLKTHVQELCFAYGHCVHSCAEHIAYYEGQFFLLANRHGVLPKHYLSTTARELYRSMLLKKIQAIHDLVERLETICSSTIHTGISDLYTGRQSTTSLMCRLLIQQSFCDFFHQMQNKRSPSVFGQVDLVWESFFGSLSSYASTVHGSSIDIILKEHDRVREGVGVTLKQAISLMEAVPHGPGNCQLASSSNAEPGRSSQYVLLLRFLESMDRAHPLKSFRSSLAYGLRICTYTWIDSRSSCQSASIGDCNCQRIQMPFRLMKIMANDGEDALASCYGGMEESRVACILVSLLFRQFSYICDEWRAKIAEQELLQSMGSDGENIQKSAVSNAKTKGRSKTKRIVSSVSVHGEESPSHTPAASTLLEGRECKDLASAETVTQALHSINKRELKESINSKPNLLQCAVDVTSAKTLHESNKLNSSHDESVYGGTGTNDTVKVSAQPCIKSKPKPGKKNEKFGKTEQEDCAILSSPTHALQWCGMQLEADFLVGVLDDDGGFQSARDFLMARLWDLDEANGI